jgi:hypothetical protein
MTGSSAKTLCPGGKSPARRKLKAATVRKRTIRHPTDQDLRAFPMKSDRPQVLL